MQAGCGVAVRDVDERRELRPERLGEAVHEEVVRRALGKLVGGIDVSHRCALVPAGDHRVVEAVNLEPAVVAAAVVPGRRHHAERARLERHHHGGGVDVAELGELRIALHAAGGIHLDGLLPGDPPQHVEVVHRAVAEDAAGTGDVLHRRRGGIHRGAAHRVEEAERTVVDRTFGRGERGVEPPLVTDLHRHAGAGDDVGDPGAFRGGGGDRLLAERGNPALDGGQCQLGMGRRRRRDHHSVDTRGEQLVDRISRCGTVFGGDCRDELGPLVGDHQTVDAVEPAEGVGVEGADAAQSDYAECGHGILRSSWSRSATSSSSG